LAWLVDALDTYIYGLQREPVVANAGMIEALERARANGEGLRGDVRVVAATTGLDGDAEALLSEIAIVWRNRLEHRRADSKIGKSSEAAALKYSEHFADFYQGLKIDELIDHLGRTPSAAPTLKEMTAIVRAAHKFVEGSDGYLLRRLNLESYFRKILIGYLTCEESSDSRSVMSRAGNIWGRSPERRRSTMINIAINNGFARYHPGAPNELSVEAIEKLMDLTPRAALAELGVRPLAQSCTS